MAIMNHDGGRPMCATISFPQRAVRLAARKRDGAPAHRRGAAQTKSLL
jgi:hypothetical protein